MNHLLEDLCITNPRISPEEFVCIEINGNKYGYLSDTMSNDELLRKFNAIMKHSAGRALQWLKRNSRLVYSRDHLVESKELQTIYELIDELQKDPKLKKAPYCQTGLAPYPNEDLDNPEGTEIWNSKEGFSVSPATDVSIMNTSDGDFSPASDGGVSATSEGVEPTNLCKLILEKYDEAQEMIAQSGIGGILNG